MIPRTKVNYGIGDLLRAVFVREGGKDHRGLLADMLRRYLGAENLLLVPSGRGGLYFILKAIDKPRVVVPSYTCNAVIEAALMAGKEVVRVEVEDGGFNMPASSLEAVVDEHAIVIATHQFGIPCEIEKMRALCATAGATLVEDAAASIGSRVNGRLTGTFGDLAFYSFDSTKLINVPMKGGFVTARDADLFARIKGIYLAEIIPMPALHKLGLLAKAAILTIIENHFLYRLFHWLTFGLTGRFTAESADLDLEKGEFYIYDLANWQAGIAAPQVAGIDKIIAVRQETYARYRSELRDCTAFDLPPCDTASEWACIRFPIRIRGDKYSFYRSAVRRGIDFAFSFTYIACPRDFRNATRLAESVLDLPFYSKLSNKEFQRVVRALKSLDATAGRCIRGT